MGCLNPWDVQSKHIQPENGIAETLYSGECRYGGGESYVMEEKPETICIDGNGSRDSHFGNGYRESDVMYTLNTIEQHGVLPVSASGIVAKGNGESFLMEEKTSSLATGGGLPGQGYPAALISEEPIVLESNQNHATVTDNGVSPTLPASMGMGGGYVPMVTDRHSISFQERAGKPGGGKGILIQDEHTGALSTLNIQHVFSLETYHCETDDETAMTLKARDYKDPQSVYCVQQGEDEPRAYGICSYDSNAMKSSNPHSGVYEADTSRTLDLNGGSPACNQGGMMIVQPTMVLNDQGGSVMNISEEVTSTLRAQDHGHPPLVFSGEDNGSVFAAGFSFGQSAKARSLGYQEEVSPTLRGGEGGNQKPCILDQREAYPIENHPNDSRVKVCEDGVFQTLSSRMGTGGNNTPLVMEAIPFDTTQITSPDNWSKPKPGDPCHPLAAEAHPPAIAFTQNQREEVRDLDDTATAIQAEPGMHQQTYVATCIGNGQADIASHISEEVSQTLNCMHDQLAVHVSEEETTAVDCRNATENPDVNGTLQAKEQGQNLNSNNVCRRGNTVRRLTPLECERLQAFPTLEWLDVSKMTKDEYIAWNLAVGNVTVNAELGKVYKTRGPGGKKLSEPKEVIGTLLNGYLVTTIANKSTKMQCRLHRIVWISQHGIIPDGYVIDHINNNKTDNRISNLQLLTPEENSNKAKEDGLYKTGFDNKITKLDPALRDEIAYLYRCSPMTIRSLASLYGVSKSRIGQIVQEIGWTDIGEWTDSNGKVHKDADTPRYKALGNSIALPFWDWLLGRIAEQYDRPATLGSLFDGISGFPLLWEKHNGRGTALWTSEIEAFPIAVCKRHFGDEDTGEVGDLDEFF